MTPDAAGGAFETPPVAIQTALSLARRRLGLDLAFVSHVHEDERIFMFVDTELTESPVSPGASDPLDEAYCSLVLDGSMPRFVGDLQAHEGLPALSTRESYGIRAHAGIPLVLSDGTVFGTFCLIGLEPAEVPAPEVIREVEVLAAFVAEQVERDVVTRAEWERDRLDDRAALIQSVAHEVRTPLTVIQGVAEMFDRLDRLDADDARELVGSVAASSRRLAELIDRVVGAADALSAPQGTTDVEPGEVVRETVHDLGASERVDITPLDGPVAVACSRRALDVVLGAATEHALLQSVPGSSVDVRARCDERSLHVLIGYESLGVERAGDRTRPQRTSGAGVRLLLASNLARHVGGRLDFRLDPGGRAAIEMIVPLTADGDAGG